MVNEILWIEQKEFNSLFIEFAKNQNNISENQVIINENLLNINENLINSIESLELRFGLLSFLVLIMMIWVIYLSFKVRNIKECRGKK